MKLVIHNRLLLLIALLLACAGLAAQQQETEPNNSIMTADTIQLGEEFSGMLSDNSDRDFVAFFVPRPGIIEASALLNQGIVNAELSLFDASPPVGTGLELNVSNQESVGVVSLAYLICVPGYYVLRIRRGSGGTANMSPYTLLIELNESDQNEFNQNNNTATPITSGQPVTGAIYPVSLDRDVFEMTVNVPGTFKFRATNIAGGLNLAVEVSGPGLSSNFFRNSFGELSFDLRACQPGTYYFELDRGAGSSSGTSGTYELQIDYYTDDIFECNDDLSSAVTIVDCDTIYASIFPEGDDDYFPFQVPAPGTYNIIVRDLEAPVRIVGNVINEFGNNNFSPTITASFAGASISIPVTITDASQIYYLHLRDNSAPGSSEDLYQVIFPFGNDCSQGLPVLDCGLSVDALTPPSCDQADGSITLSALNGVPPYAYQIDGPVADAAMSNGGAIFNGLLAGNYTAMATDGAGCTAEASFDLINDDAPQADFIFATNFLTATFQNNSAGVVDSVLWDFGDGELSNEYSPVHTFAQPGTYTVALAVFGPCGENITALLVSVGNVNVDPPVAAFTASPLQGCAPLAVTFDNASQNAGSYIWIFEGGIPSFSLDAMPPAVAFNAPGSHAVYLIAINTAGERDTTSLTVEVQEAPTAAFSVQVDNNFVAFGNQSANADAYEWHFGDGATSSLAGPTHTYSSPGNYTVLLIASNGCADTASQTIQIGTPPSGNIVIDLGEAEGLAGEAVLVPVIVREVFDTLTSLQGTVEFLTPGVGRIVGDSSMVSGILAVNYNTGSFSLLFGQGLLAGAADTLFYLRVELIGNPGDMSELILTGNQAPIEITVVENGALASPDYVTETGKITILENANIDGNITFWSTGGPVRDVRVSLDIAQTPADPDAMQVTASDGRYHFDNIPAGSNVTISCLKDINLLNGVTTGPLYYVQEYIVNGNSPNINSPYQLIAADANCDDAVTTGDLALIQRVIVGLTPDFSPCNSWAFARADANLSMNNALPYPALYNLPSLASDIAVDFVGVKVGDILGAASPQNRSNGPLDYRTLHKLSFEAGDRPVQAGEAVELQLRSGNFHHIGSLQFALQYAPHQLEFLGFGAEEGALLPIYNAVQEEGLIRLSWLDRSAQGLSFPAEQAALRLRFRATAPLSSLREALRIAPSVMKAEALNTAGEELEVQLGWQSVSDAKRQEQPAGYQLYQNIPNPARSKTSISFLLPRAEHASIQVIGPLGEVLAQYEGNFPVGRNEIEVHTERLPAGLYYYRLATSNYTATRSMLVR